MDLFGDSRVRMWQTLSAQIGGKYVDAGEYQSERIVAQVDKWMVTLDAVDGIGTLYTRLRAPFVNKMGLRFSVSRVELIKNVPTLMARNDITVGDPFFDDRFLVQ